MTASQKKFWIISGWNSTKKLCEFRVPLGSFTEKGMASLLQALTAKHALTESEIIGCYAKANTKLHSDLLEVQQYSRPFTLSCGLTIHFIARAVTE